MKLVNIGYGNMVNSQRIVSVVSPDAAPIKRLVQDTRSTGKLVDATGGKKTSQGAQKNGAITLHTPVPADQKDWKTRAMAAEVKLKEKEKELAKERKRREREGESFICTFQCQSLSGN